MSEPSESEIIAAAASAAACAAAAARRLCKGFFNFSLHVKYIPLISTYEKYTFYDIRCIQIETYTCFFKLLVVFRFDDVAEVFFGFSDLQNLFVCI